MPIETNKKPCCTGLLAHVDAGKTTLSETLLFTSGVRRVLGRVDHGDALLDSHSLERQRGITIFSKQARLETEHHNFILVDTPGHVDFSAEAERTLQILDCAVLVISGTDGVQAHTHTLWQLLERYGVPTILFVNKMDLTGADREALMKGLQKLSSGCVDFGGSAEQIAEAAAMCDEALLETFLETGEVSQGNLRGLFENRKLFPVCFGSALKLQGVDALLELLDAFAPEKTYSGEFAARVYKISRDPQGNRLTWLKITGGTLKPRTVISYANAKGDRVEEKITQIRRYSGDKFEAAELVPSGEAVAVTGLSQTVIGQGLGAETGAEPPVLEPVMTYRVALPGGGDPVVVLSQLRQLEEEDPMLHLLWQGGQIHVQLMGTVQMEVFRALVSERFHLDVTLEDRRIFYKETILEPVEGIGHFEPLRHYAEVHLLLEPLAPGSGLVFDTALSADQLDAGYQSLILTHLGEKAHLGVLVGAPITDMKITLAAGKAHLKHTEGGDFRQATYRAVRQGLMQAKSRLLEPWYAFVITAPNESIGRAITDIRTMGGSFESPEGAGDQAVLRGLVPAGEVKDYAQTLAAYTQGRGSLQLSLHGYAPCHNEEAVVAAQGYDPESDLENTPDSVFCAHGAGFNVKWRDVPEYMHLESCLKAEKPPQEILRRSIDEKELERIMEREFGPIRRKNYVPPKVTTAKAEVTIRPPREKYLIVDGYNIVFAWDGLKETAQHDLDAARRALCDVLSSYAGFTKQNLVVVFDGYKVPGGRGEKEKLDNFHVVFTKEGETADQYIESMAAEIGKNYDVRVASSDALVQLSTFRSGILRMSARELYDLVAASREDMARYYSAK